RRDLLADRGHPQERAQGARNRCLFRGSRSNRVGRLTLAGCFRGGRGNGAPGAIAKRPKGAQENRQEKRGQTVTRFHSQNPPPIVGDNELLNCWRRRETKRKIPPGKTSIWLPQGWRNHKAIPPG